MRRGQISLDFLFAVTLVMITMLNVVYIANSERGNAETFDTVSRLKVFSVDVRDTVAKVYASGDGFSVRKTAPFTLKSGEKIVVRLKADDNTITVIGIIGGKRYTIVQKSPVPIYQDDSIQLSSNRAEIWIVAREEEGKTYVELQASP
ncbi:hypothetical protein GQS_05685 [Thermococcus sp. 4557]|uniref:hypothetical protein n=1 Tax=Thermococcus sp. (strain CGMCC 1.5172 / 4557) TaxID=1042877 RepID=UPI000219EE09|nr:hypothetical protein [Thermococcus sp. 4557]AEK73037.1 hypothetical protein GQS_05685 [Thermococcus sp. 4557]